MNNTERKHNYWRQNGTQKLTPRQERRIIHKMGTQDSRNILALIKSRMPDEQAAD